ncbi:MAG: ATP-dependent zinc metalloprotease FtsH [candidate division Kazan bacterium GW2011_GWB1_52_7]|uniref:ATP-dependent zinc metalloprotease FtsH n=1 Tax=candidate division Kazan bacterium GW2011_GWB1_52_7 TaxID=1620414 RepID=A0A0G1X638_UNCK3|nr:MAG: ATP-dependent zinc metalloprotease FtsH [candidate division Kazan bacterium GW2011_GWB1_52_7]
MPQPPKKTRPSRTSGIWSWIFILLFLGLIYWAFTTPVSSPQTLPISQVLTLIDEGKVERIEVTGNTLEVTLKSGETATSQKEPGSSFLEVLAQSGVDPAKVSAGIAVKDGFPWLDILLGSILPVALLVFFFFFFFRRAQGNAQDILSFGRSRAQLFVRGRQTRITFSDVAGVDEAKQELEEVVDFLKNAGKYRALGARIPKGVLLVGLAGTGKTLLARAVAGEANAPFYSMSGSEFMEMLVGVGAARVRDLFETAKKNSPSIIFIDEIESIGRQRGGAMTGGHEEREQTLNQILTEMDGFTPTDNVIVLAATNRPELLDPALTRPGRFDRRVVLDLPDIEGREAIVKIHARGKPFAKDVDFRKIAKRTVGFSGADLENMLNEAAILAAGSGRKQITNSDVEESATKVKLGPEKRRLQSPQEKKMPAYHEGGHAMVSAKLPHTDPVHRVSIVSRGLALGFTETPPLADKYQHTETELLERIATMMGGRAAEEVVFGEFTAGASSDLAQATLLARRMVEELGMSELGPVSFAAGERAWFGVMGEAQSWSNEMSSKVDAEVKKILDGAYEVAKKIVLAQRKRLDKVAEALLEKETLDGDEFAKLIA